MKVHVVFQFARELDDSDQLVGGIDSVEIETEPRVTQIESLKALEADMMIRMKAQQIIIINAIPLPLKGVKDESVIAVPGMQFGRGM